MVAPSPPEQFTELTDYLCPQLTDLDYSQPTNKLHVVIGAALTSCVIYVITELFFTVTSSLYRNLTLKERVFWNLSVVRSCFGLFCIIVGLWAVFGHTGLDRDVVLATTPTSHLAMTVTVGFFIFECVAVTLSDVIFGSFSAMLQVHHWLSLVGFLVVVVTDAGHTLGCRSLLLEMSTPFSCLCWTLLKAGRERGKLWKANQMMLVHTFHLRNVVEVMLWVMTYQNWSNVWTNMPWPLFLALYTQLTLVTFLMTPYWTYKKTRQMICPVDWNFENPTIGAASPSGRGSRVAALHHAIVNFGNGGLEAGNGHTDVNGNGVRISIKED